MLSAGGGIARRLLTSVSIIGRDNEPIYLLGDDYLWDRCCSSCDTDRSASSSPSSTKTTTAAVAAKMMTTPSHHDDDDDDEGKTMKIRDDGDGIDDDPFGFFETNFSNPRHRHQQQQQQQQQQQRMSLIQQLVLHASLDVFEEKISCTSSSSSARTTLSVGSKSGRDSGIGGGGGGGVRWRTPGTDSATSMYVGLLCRVEERWSVYGYLTNTGIKFLAMVEDNNIHCSSTIASFHDDEDDFFHDYPSLPSWIDEETSSMMEAEAKQMKKMFTQLHDLYVRYTMNPFSRLRSPICSIKFDDGVISLARSFNGMLDGGVGVVGSSKSSSTPKGTSGGNSPTTDGEGRKAKEEDGLSWM